MNTSVLALVVAVGVAGLPAADKEVQTKDLPAAVQKAVKTEVAVNAAGTPITP